jgi:CTP synthase (UTP-ammonia lyase)
VGESDSLPVALIGDYNPEVTAHRAIPLALQLASHRVRPTWIHTTTIPDPLGEHLVPYDGIWCVPASPYASPDGALRAIRYARESGVPFLGTCAGFQHAILEYARNVLRMPAASHAETDTDAPDLVVTPLRCALVERDDVIELLSGSRIGVLCGASTLHEEYHCRYGLNRAYETSLEAAGLRVAGRDPDGEPRIVELDDHPFYVATLFQPERAGLRGVRHPLVDAFVSAAENFKSQREAEWTTSATPSGPSPTRDR